MSARHGLYHRGELYSGYCCFLGFSLLYSTWEYYKHAVTELWSQPLFIHYSAYLQCETGHSTFSAAGLCRTSSLVNHRASLV